MLTNVRSVPDHRSERSGRSERSLLSAYADGQLLSAHAAGDRDAFTELVGRHRSRLQRLARCRTRTIQDAEDAVQDALLSAHRAAGSFRHDAAVGSWLHRILVNACTDRGRRSGRDEPLTVVDDDRCASQDRTAQVDTALVVHAALMRLPAEQRAAVVAVDMHGYSVADAAALLEIAQGTVKSRCARARARLAVLLTGTLIG